MSSNSASAPQSNEGQDSAVKGEMTSESNAEVDGLIETNWEEVVETFDGLDLHEDLLRGIYAYGFEKPSAIQQRAIKPVILGHDVIAQAQSETGKTATFA